MWTQFDKKRFVRTMPSNVREHDKVHFENLRHYDCPALQIYQFHSVNVLPDSTLFKGIFPLTISFLFFRKRIKHHNIKGIIFILLHWKKNKLVGNHPYLLIHDGWTQNYYHWITQALPRLILAQQTNKPFILLLPEDHQSEFHIASLKLLNVESWQTLERKEQYYTIQNLWYAPRDIQIGDYNDDLITTLRNKLISAPITGTTRKLFIRRVSQDKRRILNEADVLQTFLSFGFEVVEFERLSFTEQLALVRETIVLAGVHGAGLTNMIFMPSHSVVFELTTKVNGENYYYYSLSNALSHKYYYQACDTDLAGEVQDANLIVDIQTLQDNLTLMLS